MPESPLVPDEPEVPESPLVPLEPLVPESPLVPDEPDVPFSIKPTYTFSLLVKGLFPLEAVILPTQVIMFDVGPDTLVTKNVKKSLVFDIDLIVINPGALGVDIILPSPSSLKKIRLVFKFCCTLFPLI